MITIDTTPPSTFFAGNPVKYGLHSNNMVSSAGRRCSFKLVVSAAETTWGHTITFTFPGKVLIFTSADYPDDSGLQVPLALSSANWATWAQTLFDCFIANFELSSHFAITIDPPGTSNRVINFEAYNKGTADSATVECHMVTVGLYLYFSGLDATTRPNFSIIGGLWDNSMKQIVQDIKPTDDNGYVNFNFSEYLSVILENNTQPRFTWPFNPIKLYAFFTNYILEFYAGFAERYDNTIHKVLFDTMRTAFPGGLNRETMVAYTASSQDFFSVAENLLKFMTWAPLEKITSKTCPELLFFYVISKAPYDNLDFGIEVFFTEGEPEMIVQNISLAGDMSKTMDNCVIELSCGYEHLDFETRFPGRTVTQWWVKLTAPDLHVDTEMRKFILDNKVYENERIFLFRNSYGRAYDVFRFTGVGAQDIEVEFSTAISETIGDYTSFNAPVNRFGASELQKMQVSSGWISHDVKDYLRELLLSSQVFEYKDKTLFPVIITNDKMKQYFKDDEYLYEIQISYDRAYRDFFFQST